MSATEVQNPSGAAHTGTPWSWVGVSAVLVLMLAVFAIWMARPGETTRPEAVRTETTAPASGALVQAPAKGLIVRGGGYVVMPPRAAAGSGPDAATAPAGRQTTCAVKSGC
jgi:hypothetical protein